MCGGGNRDTPRLGVERGGGRNYDTTAAVRCMVFMREAILLGLEGELPRRVGRGAPCLPDSRLYLLRQPASKLAFKDWGGRGYDDSVLGEVTKTAPYGNRST